MKAIFFVIIRFPLFFSASRLRKENVNLTLHLFIALCQ